MSDGISLMGFIIRRTHRLRFSTVLIMFLSFIIPYYNAEGTINGTLSSIYNTGLDTSFFEIILVDDCSKTPAEQALKDYNYSSNLRIIRHSINKKQGAGRNTGIRAAKGDYIVFVDADDFVCKGIKSAFEKAKTTQADIVACLYRIQRIDHSIQEVGHDLSEEKLISGKVFCEKYLDPGASLSPVSCLFSRPFLLKSYTPFEEGVFMEDSDWMARHLFYANGILLCNDVIYQYAYNSTSTIHSSSNQHYADWIKAGYRKFLFSKELIHSSLIYSSIIENDARWNIIGTMKKLWSIKQTGVFYQSIEKKYWDCLNEYKWPGVVSFLIKHHKLSCVVLGIVSPLLRTYKKLRH